MLKKLQHKIIIINMVLVGSILIGAFTISIINSYRSKRLDLIKCLEGSIEPKDDKPTKQEIGAPFEDRNRYEKNFHQYYTFAVFVDFDGLVTEVTDNTATMSQDTLDSAINIALSNNEEIGTIIDLQLMYHKRSNSSGTFISFIDSSILKEELNNSIISYGIITVFCLIALYIISYLLSKMAIKPVKKTWEKQKQFIGDASHELKTPLTVILANTSIMEAHPFEKIGNHNQWLDSTKEEALHMKKLVEQMLYLAKNDIQKPNLNFSEINLSDLVNISILNFEPIAFDKKINMVTDIKDDICMSGDQTAINQLIHILIDNAIKHSPTKDIITIKLHKNKNTLVLSVNNKGAFINPDQLNHIFERFYRSDESRSTEGFGLGLAIAKSITQNHHGKIDVTSTKDNGTTFTVTFNYLSLLNKPSSVLK